MHLAHYNVSWKRSDFGEYLQVEQFPNGSCRVCRWSQVGERLVMGGIKSYTCGQMDAVLAGFTSCDEPTAMLSEFR